MPQVLKLDYACTRAEKREAEELNLRHQIARGSKWGTNIILGVALLGALSLLYLRVAHDVSAARRPYVFGALFVLIFVIVLWRQRSRRNPSGVTKLEISETELKIHSSEVDVCMPWSGFSKCLESSTLFVLVNRLKAWLLILPKRAFPDENWQSWFRNQVANRIGVNEVLPPEEPGPRQATSTDGVSLRFQLRFRDYLDRTVASWRTWAVVLGAIVVMDACFVYVTVNPPPRPVYSSTQVFFMFMLPIQCFAAIVMVVIPSVWTWFAYRKYPQEIGLSDDGIAVTSRDEQSNAKWSAYTRFKETRWSFILWSSSNPAWLMLPKRAFSAAEEERRCRDLLSSHLQRSRWFFG